MKVLKLSEIELELFGLKVGDKLGIQMVNGEIILSKIESETIEDLFKDYTGGAFNSTKEYLGDWVSSI